ncbi:MAG: Trm112 family protein [Woeseiaceae bacterium]
MMDKRLFSILHCPVTHKGLAPAKPATLKSVNTAIAAGELSNSDGTTLVESLDEALVTDDGKVLYPLANGIPVLLAGKSINLEQLG